MQRQQWLGVLITVLSVVVAAPLTHAQTATAVTTGTAVDELGEPIPDPPAGFANSKLALAALAIGQVKPVNMQQATPDDVILQTDVEYGRAGDRPLKLDLYSPKDASGPVPGLIFIHGGGWRGGKKEDYRLYGQAFAQRGYVLASVQYRLSGEATYPAAIDDVKAAVRWMRAEADAIGVDPDRIGVAGGSAGGHLAMMVAYSSDVEELDGQSGHPGVSSRVQAVVDIYGPTDLTTEFARGRSTPGSLLDRFFDGSYDEKQEDYEAASPIRYVTPDDPPTLILHGTIDDVVPINQADLLAAELEEEGVPFIYDRLPGWPHAMDVAQPVNERCIWLMERFFDRYLKQAE